jgi:hypothetical protein
MAINITSPMANGTAPVMPFDLSKGAPQLCMVVDSTELLTTMTVQQLVSVVPDPAIAEKKQIRSLDPRLAQFSEYREQMQRALRGGKKANVPAYTRYILEGLRGEREHWSIPPQTLYSPKPLEVGSFGSMEFFYLEPGAFYLNLDAETQRIAWSEVLREMPEAGHRKVAVEMYHSISVEGARQRFHDRNTYGVNMSASLAISMDAMDPITRLTRELVNHSDILRGNVEMAGRQLTASSTEVVTLSALRTGVVTTVLGTAGLRFGAKPVKLPDGVDLASLRQPVFAAWDAILEELHGEFTPTRRPASVVSAPSILGGIGAVAHRTLPAPPRAAAVTPLDLSEVAAVLRDIRWDRKIEVNGQVRSPWESVAGKFSPRGAFSIGGPKEVGHAVAEAIEHPTSEGGRRIRGHLS